MDNYKIMTVFEPQRAQIAGWPMNYRFKEGQMSIRRDLGQIQLDAGKNLARIVKPN